MELVNKVSNIGRLIYQLDIDIGVVSDHKIHDLKVLRRAIYKQYEYLQGIYEQIDVYLDAVEGI